MERGVKLCRGHHPRGRLRGWRFTAQTPQDMVGFQLLLSPDKHKSDLLWLEGVREGKGGCWGKKQVTAALLLCAGHQGYSKGTPSAEELCCVPAP